MIQAALTSGQPGGLLLVLRLPQGRPLVELPLLLGELLMLLGQLARSDSISSFRARSSNSADL